MLLLFVVLLPLLKPNVVKLSLKGFVNLPQGAALV